jgi:hypothetical protein
LSIWLSVSRNINPQTNKFEILKPAFNVVCSWCGTVIRSSNVERPEQMCLICHARMLNDYLPTHQTTQPATSLRSFAGV